MRIPRGPMGHRLREHTAIVQCPLQLRHQGPAGVRDSRKVKSTPADLKRRARPPTTMPALVPNQ